MMDVMNLNDHQLISLETLEFYYCANPDHLGLVIVCTQIIKAIALNVSSEVPLVLCRLDERSPHRKRCRLSFQALPKNFIQDQIRYAVFFAPIKFL